MNMMRALEWCKQKYTYAGIWILLWRFVNLIPSLDDTFSNPSPVSSNSGILQLPGSYARHTTADSATNSTVS